MHDENHRLVHIPLRALAVTRCLVDKAFTLECGTPPGSSLLRIGGPFELKIGKTHFELDGGVTAGLGPALTLVGRSIESSVVDGSGELTIRFSGDLTVSVPPSDLFEAWEIVMENGYRVICGPGGHLTIWSGDAGPAHRKLH